MKVGFFFKLLLFLIIGLVFFSLFGGVRNINWSPIDDHEIMFYLGRDSYLSVASAWEKFLSTEAFLPGNSPRYRPAYYFLRFIEMIVWGKNPMIWHLFRFFIAVSFLFCSFFFVKEIFGFGIGAVFALAVLNYSFWNELFVDLGPAETYVMLGWCFILPALRWVVLRSNYFLSFLLLSAGMLICVGSKEQMVYLIPFYLPISIFLLIFVRRTSLRLVSIFVMLLVLSFGVLTIYAILKIPAVTGGVDIYQNSMQSSERIKNSLSALHVHIGSAYLFLGFIFPTILNFFALLHISLKRKIKLFNLAVLWFCFMFLMSSYVVQLVFYNGQWPNGTRYDFPGIYLMSYAWLFLIFILTKKFGLIRRLFLAISIIFLVYFTNRYGFYYPLRSYIDKKSKMSFIFNHKLSTMLNTVKKNDLNCDLVLYADDPWSYEPIFSVSRFIYSSNFDIKYSVVSSFCRGPESIFHGDKLKEYLAQDICRLSVKGDPANHISIFSHSKNKCCIFLNPKKDEDGCLAKFDISGSI